MGDMPGMADGAVGGGHGAAALATPGLIPGWLGVIGALLFLGVMAAHLRHVAVRCSAPRRCWHWGHVLMAASMVVMYLPTSMDPLHIPAAGWRALFIVALIALAVSGVVEVGGRRAVSGLWLLIGLDFAAMLYMWSPGTYSPFLSAMLCTYLVLAAGFWFADRSQLLDRPLVPSLYALNGGGVIGIAAAPSVTAHRELRISMTVMALGMAYMVGAAAAGAM
jgi:hypothetical protein